MNPWLWLLLLPPLAWLVYALLPTCYYKYFSRRFRRQPLAEAAPTASKAVMLTFDDGPDPHYTPQLLDLLAATGVRATFFLLAAAAAEQPQLVARIQREGHRLALHGLTHENPWRAGRRATRRQLGGGLFLLPAADPEIRYYRPPHGNLNLSTLYYLRRYRLQLLLWTVMAEDWRADQAPEQILAKLRRRVRAGSIICLHDAGAASGGAPGAPARTIAALTTFLPELQAQGYQFILP